MSVYSCVLVDSTPVIFKRIILMPEQESYSFHHESAWYRSPVNQDDPRPFREENDTTSSVFLENSEVEQFDRSIECLQSDLENDAASISRNEAEVLARRSSSDTTQYNLCRRSRETNRVHSRTSSPLCADATLDESTLTPSASSVVENSVMVNEVCYSYGSRSRSVDSQDTPHVDGNGHSNNQAQTIGNASFFAWRSPDTDVQGAQGRHFALPLTECARPTFEAVVTPPRSRAVVPRQVPRSSPNSTMSIYQTPPPALTWSPVVPQPSPQLHSESITTGSIPKSHPLKGRKMEPITWQAIECPAAPRPRSLHTSVMMGRCLYLFGGYDGKARLSDLHEFNLDTSTWTDLTPSVAPANLVGWPGPRDRHCSIALDDTDEFFVFGGYDGSSRVNDLWSYNIKHKKWECIPQRERRPTPRHSHSAVVHEGTIYVFGGYDGNYRSDLFAYHPTLREWRHVHHRDGRQPAGRYRASAVVRRNSMFLYAGHDGKTHLRDLHEFDFVSLCWREVCSSTAPDARDSHIAVMAGGSMFVFGGSSKSVADTSPRAKHDLHEFHFDTGTWAMRQIAEEPLETDANGEKKHTEGEKRKIVGRFCHSGSVFEDALYVFGGYDGTSRLSEFIKITLCEPTLRWPLACNSGGNEVLKRGLIDLEEYVNNPQFSDVTFCVDGRLVHAHKMICARCPYFRAMFMGNMREANQTTPIAIGNVSHNIFILVLRFLYCERMATVNELGVSFDLGMKLFFAADLFGLEELKVLCERRLLDGLTIHNVSDVLKNAESHNASRLRESCVSYIVKYFDQVSRTESFGKLVDPMIRDVFHRR